MSADRLFSTAVFVSEQDESGALRQGGVLLEDAQVISQRRSSELAGNALVLQVAVIDEQGVLHNHRFDLFAGNVTLTSSGARASAFIQAPEFEALASGLPDAPGRLPSTRFRLLSLVQVQSDPDVALVNERIGRVQLDAYNGQ